jgi:hypothetical protein
MRNYLILLVICIILANVTSATEYYSYDNVLSCQEKCYPFNNPIRDRSCIFWINSDEWSYGTQEPCKLSDRNSLYTKCASVDYCKAVCWNSEYRDRSFTNYDPWPTKQESQIAIANYTQAISEWKNIADVICNYKRNKWGSIASNYQAIGTHYEYGLNNTLLAAKAYHDAASYFEQSYEKYEKNQSNPSNDPLKLAYANYKHAGESYCNLSMDEAAHLEFDNVRRMSVLLGENNLSLASIDNYECGKYAKPKQPEYCPFAFLLLGLLAVGCICSNIPYGE